ncbi:hypothetical protein OG897_11585 [Streptomyces sp. NBC_00237]|uniref:hypothetical protein n=1 Tax=Streptomyces sp. NBC_00237 TaxID=2975687 RepID=UPI00224DAA76|nr:hypothetical protein [Streptomyces sp. NBC_00237]MCX5202091.1 hypothetical protein [Streptomyces sp. NBC_00237]
MSAHSRRAAALVLSSIVLAGSAGTAAVHAALPDEPAPAVAAHSAPAEPARFGATCRTVIERSKVVSYCHNPYPEADLVQLHTECARWWDLDGDATPVEVGPAETVRLTGRCWKEVGGAWVTHERAPDHPSPPVRRGRTP